MGRGRVELEEPAVLTPTLLPQQRCPLKPPAQVRWASGRMDISNKTYETVTSLEPAASQTQSEDCPPPLPVKNPSRTMVQERAGHTRGGMVGCPQKIVIMPFIEGLLCARALSSEYIH